MKQLFYTLMLCSGIATAQNITFEYDAAGNQISRSYCLTCNNKAATQKAIAIEDLKDEDLQKFLPQDEFSFYPNPVKEQLYLKWQFAGNKTFTTLQLYDANGRMLSTQAIATSTNSTTVAFLQYPKGLYIIVLQTNDGEQKTIKIMK